MSPDVPLKCNATLRLIYTPGVRMAPFSWSSGLETLCRRLIVCLCGIVEQIAFKPIDV